MSESDELEPTEPHPEMTAMLRDEPVAVDPARREAAIDAALELGAVLWDAEEPVDELAARRSVAPVPAPRRAGGGGPRRVALVAAAVAVIAGLGIAGVLAGRGNGDFMAVSDESADSAGSAADSGSADSGSAASSPAESSPADADRSRSADPGDAGSNAPAEDQAKSPEELLTTTAPTSAGAAADLGSFESVDALLDAMVANGYRSATPETSTDGSSTLAQQPDCPTGAVDALLVTGRATVGSTPVWVAVTGADPSILVVLDAVTCAELGRR